MWREITTAAYQNREKIFDIEPVFKEPALAEEIAAAEASLGVKLPADLKSLLLETDGVDEKWPCRDGWSSDCFLWSLQRIVKENLEMRNLEAWANCFMPLDNLLFFAGSGTGDYFGFPITRDGTVRDDWVFVWDHETDSRSDLAFNLKHFIEGWLGGTVTYR